MGKVLLRYESLSSTNQCALDLLAAKNKPSEGTVISADYQSAGRGQSGSSWLSEPGENLTFSLILYPHFLPVRQQFLLNQAVALAATDVIKALLPKRTVKLKWPNDVYVADQKIGGILIQNTIGAMQLQSTVVGIGINVKQMVFPTSLPNPTSLFLEKQKTIEPDDLLERLCQSLEYRYLQLRRREFATIQEDYLDRLYRFQEDAAYQNLMTNEFFMGKIIGLEETGKLILSHKNGETAFDLKEIKFL